MSHLHEKVFPTKHEPPNEFVEDFYEFLDGDYLGITGANFESIKREWDVLVRVAVGCAARLEKPADEKELKEGVCIFGEVEGGSSSDKLVGVRVEVSGSRGLERQIELVAEDYILTLSGTVSQQILRMGRVTLRFVFCVSLDGPLPSFDSNPLKAWFDVALLRLDRSEAIRWLHDTTISDSD